MFDKSFTVLTESVERFSSGNGFANAAAIAYYAAFSLPSMLLISISLVGLFVEPVDVTGEINRQIENVAGEEAAEQVQQIVSAANQPRQSLFATLVGGVMLLIGSTGVLVQLQTALNEVWGVKSGERTSAWLSVILKRVISLGMLLVMAFLLLITISVRALMSELGGRLDDILPTSMTSGMLLVVNQLVGVVVFALLIAAMFRFLPATRVPWRSVWFGALVTTILFAIGRQAMGLYLTMSDPGAIYGAAGSLAIILIWVYYASLIFIFGAQLTQAWSENSEAVAA